MSATLQTVADAVGVSRSSVSNAYSRPDQLSPELRQRILDAAQRLGYAGPNPTARSLRRGRTGAIGVLVTATLSSALADPYAVRFLRGLAESGERYGSGLLLLPMPVNDDKAAGDLVRNAVVDGFCVYCVPDWHGSLDAIRSRGLPMVSAELRADGDQEALCVGIDEAAASRNAARHVAALGHRRVALLATWSRPDRVSRQITVGELAEVPYYVTRERLHGYCDALDEAGLDRSDVTIVEAAESTRVEGAAAAAYVLDRAPRPTAILAMSDLLALGALDALAARGLRPGRDVSVVGFDDIPEAADAQLTTIRQPSIEKGRIAGGLLLDPPADPHGRRIVLPTELVVRASTGPSPTGRI
ncbi:LacI family DNA-binding transcriptional regulator [Polymorphospora sp. NPDC050346]|uniref:LacI family DNA-binding transcriptional regulator n=1 Tax=Polymorphospora sp. NPDC050346 TaxID=3155780 RepID=UPI003406A29B